MLTAAGHDVAKLPAGMRGASDRAVLKYAAASRPILVTLDKDFGDLVFLSRRPRPPSVVLVRMQPYELTDRVPSVVKAIESAASRSGSFVVIGRDGVRTRSLPSDSSPT